jgi:hypothetical protein
MRPGSATLAGFLILIFNFKFIGQGDRRMRSNRCERAVVAEGPGARIERCNCGAVHLSLGPVTVRLDPESFESFAVTVAYASARMARPSPHLRAVDSDLDG